MRRRVNRGPAAGWRPEDGRDRRDCRAGPPGTRVGPGRTREGRRRDRAGTAPGRPGPRGTARRDGPRTAPGRPRDGPGTAPGRRPGLPGRPGRPGPEPGRRQDQHTHPGTLRTPVDFTNFGEHDVCSRNDGPLRSARSANAACAACARCRRSPQYPYTAVEALQRGAKRVRRSAGRIRNELWRRGLSARSDVRPRDARRVPPPRVTRGHDARRRGRAATPRGRASRGRAHSIGVEPSRTARAQNDSRTCGAGEGVLSMARGSPMTPS